MDEIYYPLLIFCYTWVTIVSDLIFIWTLLELYIDGILLRELKSLEVNIFFLILFVLFARSFSKIFFAALFSRGGSVLLECLKYDMRGLFVYIFPFCIFKLLVKVNCFLALWTLINDCPFLEYLFDQQRVYHLRVVLFGTWFIIFCFSRNYLRHYYLIFWFWLGKCFYLLI